MNKHKTKLTVEVPEEILKKARESTGRGITATIVHGLKLVAAMKTYEQLRRLRGTMKLSVNVKKLREDRS